jgi:anti-sigma regulatory factor (Ser/Thr protein kinase)
MLKLHFVKTIDIFSPKSMEHARQRYTFQSRLDELVRLTEVLDQWGEEHGIPPGIVGLFNVCLDEIITNIIKHGYESVGTEGLIWLDLATSDTCAEAVTMDEAPAFDPLSRATPDVDLELEDRPIGGLGIHLVREMMDEVSYMYADGKNCFSMRKSISD